MKVAGVLALVAVLSSGAAMAQEDRELKALLNLDQAMDQLKGSFPDLARERMPAGRIQESWAKARPGAAVREVRHDPLAEIKLRIREGAHTLVVLPAWERVKAGNLVLSSKEAVQVKATPEGVGNRLVLVPGQVGRDATITVMGESGRIYAFYVVVENDRSTNVPDLMVYVDARQPLDWEPPAAERVRSDGRPADWVKEIPFNPTTTRFDYTMSGDREIAPRTVFSDGIFTFLHFGDDQINRMDLPSVHRVVDNVDTPVNVRRAGDMVIVEAPVGAGLTLRNGQRVVCIRSSSR